MNKSRSSITKYLGMLAICIFTLLTINTKAQSEKIELTVTVVNSTSQTNSDGKILLAVESSHYELVYQLFDSAPWKGGKQMSTSGSTTIKKYQFDNLPSGSYFVCATDDMENSKCEIVTIGIE